MKRFLSTFALLALSALFTGSTLAGEKEAKKEGKNPATTPSPRMGKDGPDAGWMTRHEGFVAIAKKGDVDVLLLGDSITDAWRGGGAKAAWSKHFAHRKAANFGIGGDRTEHVLWRIQNGELDGIKPKVAMLMIGTNNSGSNSAEQISEGVTEIVKTLRTKTPDTKILLLGVFPRGQKADDAQWTKIKEINATISKLDDGKNIVYLDIGKAFLGKEGVLTKEIMPDFLHLSEAGYNIWGREVEPALEKLLGETK